MSRVVDVNEQGIDAAGNDYNIVAHPDKLAAGMIVYEAVTLRYPDGRLEAANEARITEKGMLELGRWLGKKPR